MGNDGGSIPKRRELVKNAARAPNLSELKATTLEALAHAWATCYLSGDALDRDNTVSDWRGRLFNYEAVLTRLMPAAAGDAGDDGGGGAVEGGEVTLASTGVRSLRDVVRLRFKRYAPDGKGADVWACPVSMKEIGPATRAVYLVPCGHVFAEAAIKEIPDRACPECSEAFEDENVIPLLPTDSAETARLETRLENLKAKGLTHSLKKDKSNGKKKRKAGEAHGEDGADAVKKTKKKPSKTSVESKVSGINNPMTASITAKVMAEQGEMNKRRKLAAAMN